MLKVRLKKTRTIHTRTNIPIVFLAGVVGGVKLVRWSDIDGQIVFDVIWPLGVCEGEKNFIYNVHDEGIDPECLEFAEYSGS